MKSSTYNDENAIRSHRDAVFDMMVSTSPVGHSSTQMIQLGSDPGSLSTSFIPNQTGAPLHSQPQQWTQDAQPVELQRFPTGKQRVSLVYERTEIDERGGGSRTGSSMGSKSIGASQAPSCYSCGEYCTPQTRLASKPYLTPVEHVVFDVDPGGNAVSQNGTTTCMCGTAAVGGPSLFGVKQGTTGTEVVLPSSVFAVAMQEPSIEWLAERLVRANIIKPPPNPPRHCRGLNRPCLCSLIGPALAHEFQSYIATWSTTPWKAFTDLVAGLDLIHEQFEAYLLTSVYNRAARTRLREYDTQTGAQKFMGDTPLIERNIRGFQPEYTPELVAGKRYHPLNGDSPALVRTLSGPTKIFHKQFQHHTNLRMTRDDVSTQSETPRTTNAPRPACGKNKETQDAILAQGILSSSMRPHTAPTSLSNGTPKTIPGIAATNGTSPTCVSQKSRGGAPPGAMPV